jgi:hypothetical protein
MILAILLSTALAAPAKLPAPTTVTSAVPATQPTQPATQIKCYTLQDVKDEGCLRLCLRDNHDSGRSTPKGCVCEDIQENYDDYTHRRIHLGTSNLPPVEGKKDGLVVPFRPNSYGNFYVSPTYNPSSNFYEEAEE